MPKKPTRSWWEAFGMSTSMIEQGTMRKENFFQESKTRDVVAESKNSRRGKRERKCQIEMYNALLESLNLKTFEKRHSSLEVTVLKDDNPAKRITNKWEVIVLLHSCSSTAAITQQSPRGKGRGREVICEECA